MIRVTCYIRPHRLEQVKSAIAALGVTGMTVSDVRGAGNSLERSEWFGGGEDVIALPIKARIEVVADDSLSDEIVQAILENARTGAEGDGKVFIEQISNAIRIRTLESGAEAV